MANIFDEAMPDEPVTQAKGNIFDEVMGADMPAAKAKANIFDEVMPDTPAAFDPQAAATAELAKSGLSPAAPPAGSEPTRLVRPQHSLEDFRKSMTPAQQGMEDSLVSELASTRNLGDALYPGAGKIASAPGQYIETFTHPEKFGTEGEASKARTEAGTQLLEGGMEALSPAFAGAAITNPARVAKDVGIGLVTGGGVGYAAKKAGLSPESQEFAETAGFFLPSVYGLAGGTTEVGVNPETGQPTAQATVLGDRAGARVERTPEGGVRVSGKLGPLEGSRTFGGRTQNGAQLEAPTIEGESSPAQPKAPQPPPDANVAAMSRNDIARAMAASQTGAPPPNPAIAPENVATAGAAQAAAQPAQPQGPKPPDQVTAQTVQAIGSAIAAAPPEARPKLVDEAHGNLARWMMSKGKVVSPFDGKIYVVDSEKQANKLAADWINEQVDRHDAATAERQKATEAPAAGTGEGKAAPAGAGPAGGEQPRVIGTPEHPAVEESRATIDAQIEEMKKGNAALVMLPKGSTYHPTLPDGMAAIGVNKGPGAGVYFYDPAKLKPSQIRKAAEKGEQGKLLGYVQNKTEIGDNPAVVVQAKTPEGTPVHEALVEPHKVAEQVAATQERHPDATIEIKHPEQVIQERVEAAAKADIFDEVAPEPLKKGQRVTFQDNDGTERTGTLKHLNDLAARVEEDGTGKKFAIAASKVKAAAESDAKIKSEERQPDNELKQARIAGDGVPMPSGEKKELARPSVIVARHGTTSYDHPENPDKEIIAGWTNPKLDERGHTAADRLAKQLKPYPVSKILTSDLTRAHETANHIGKELGVKVEPTSKLRPWNPGSDIVGHPSKDVQDKLEHYVKHPDEAPPGGESYNSFLKRWDAVVAEAQADAEKGEVPLLVAHSRNMEALPRSLAEAKDIPITGGPEPGSAVMIEKGDKGWQLAGKAESEKQTAAPQKESAEKPAAEAEHKYKFGSTQTNIPKGSEAANALATARERISKSDLMATEYGGDPETGLETDPHVTVRYGIQGEDTAGIRAYLEKQAPFEATLGKTASFPPSEHSDGAAVIIAPIEAPELHRIESELAKHGDFKERSFPEYKPHSTVAYVKPEAAPRYTGMTVTEGKKFTVKSIAITDRDGNQDEVELKGNRSEAGPAAVSKTTTEGSSPSAPATAAPAYEPAIGEIVHYDGRPYEVGFTSGSRVRLQNPETHQRLQGWFPKNELTPAPKQSPLAKLADAVYAKLNAGESLGNVTAFNKLAEQSLGAGWRTGGEITPKDAFDAMEAGINKYLVEYSRDLMKMDAIDGLKWLRSQIMANITSQGVRTEEQLTHQQFSTPPTEAYVAAKVADIKPGDVVLEPSAGNGGLAVFAKAAGAEVHVNEISPRRRQMLKDVGFEGVTDHDGEIINSLLDESVKPTVVLMNPPFSAKAAAAGKGANSSKFGFNHVDSALQRLEPGGRLVAILGGGRDGFPKEGASFANPAANEWFTRLAKKYNIRANIRVSGKEYQKYGTSYATRIVVIDKDGPTSEAGGDWPSVVKGAVDTLEEGYNLLRPVAESRPDVTADTTRPASTAGARETEPAGRLDTDRGQGDDRTGVGSREVRGVGAGIEPARPARRPAEDSGLERPAGSDRGTRPGGGDKPLPLHEPGTEPADDTGRTAAESAESGDADLQPERPLGLDARGLTPPEKLDLTQEGENTDREQEDSGAYVLYRPTLKGPAHPGDVVETKAMSTVPLPKITYKPSLPDSVVKEGRLSAIQLEAISIAGQQNAVVLPGGHRASALIGDGTGVGKGRIGAGILWDNWMQGRKRLVWVSEKWDLMQDAMRDLKGIGADDLAKKVKAFQKFEVTAPIEHEGILFTTYALIRSADKKGNSRVAQLEKWLKGADNAEGAYILYDESHNLKNAVSSGRQPASQIGKAVKEMMNRAANLRTVSLSATAASDVMNLGYLDRLGLWGPGTPFPGGFEQFAGEVGGGGISAMELIARELKAQGKYVARTLSYKGVTYTMTEHKLTPEQKDVYKTAAKAWRSVQQNAEDTIKDTLNGGGKAKGNFLSQFYAAQQRFFNLLITTLKIPTAVEQANKALADNKSVLITLVNTNEAAQNREKDRVSADTERDIDEPPDYDFGPKSLLIDVVKNHYPTQQWEDAIDDQGRPYKRPVVDREGRPVQNPEAIRARDALVKKIDRDLKMPDNPLDILISSLGGASKVAELTGRKERMDPATGRLVARGAEGVPRDKVNLAEMRGFQEGKKRVAILSNAAGTGISLHAGNDVANKQKRYHITLQAGWSADKAMQMLGRSHRTNQAQPPEYDMLVSDLGGEKRFISSISRRLGSLGALSRGQKNAASGTDAMDKFNFESNEGRSAAKSFYEGLMKRGAMVPGTDLKGMDVLETMGVLKDDANQGRVVPEKDRTNVTRLLNRILSLNPDVQNAVYDYYYDVFQAVVQRAVDDGTLDTGVRTLPGDEFHVQEERPVATDPQTGAQTLYYPVEAKVKRDRVSPAQLDKLLKKHADENGRILVDNKGRTVFAYNARPIVHADGKTTEATYLVTPETAHARKVENWNLHNYQTPEEHGKEQFEKAEKDVKAAQSNLTYYGDKPYYKDRIAEAQKQLSEAESARDMAAPITGDPQTWAKEEWGRQYEAAPNHESVEHHLVGGAVLRWWNQIRAASETLHVFTTVDSETGKRVVGVEVPASEIRKLLSRISGSKSTVDSTQMGTDVLKNGLTFTLEQNVQVKRGRVAGSNVIQIIPPSQVIANHLKQLGLLYEKGVTPIYYVPMMDSIRPRANQRVLDAVLAAYPVTTDEGAGDTTMGMGAIPLPIDQIKAIYEKEVLPALDKTKVNLSKALAEIQHLVAPRAGVARSALDTSMKLTGERAKRAFILDQVLAGAERMFDKLPIDDQVAFVDRFKEGEKQPTPELQQIADFMGRTDDATYRSVIGAQVKNLSKKAQNVWREMSDADKTTFIKNVNELKADDLAQGVLKELANGILSHKENHYRVLWRVIPMSGDDYSAAVAAGETPQGTAKSTGALHSRRPLQGTKGFMRQSTLDTMSDGLDRGGEPVSYNPVTMFRTAQSDSWRYITAQNMWHDAKAQGARVFVRRGTGAPEGFKRIDDRIGDVRFPAASGEGLIEAGHWYLRDDYHRLLSNFLSRDWIRESTVGNGLMKTKNQLTAYRLGFSPFHAITTSVSAIASQAALGLGELWNQGVRHLEPGAAVKGLRDIATAPLAPYTLARLGGQGVRYVTTKYGFVHAANGADILRQFPDADQLLDMAFSGGAKFSLHEDERMTALGGLRRALAEDRYIAAALWSPFALNQKMFAPLFEYMIPRVKLGSFLREYSQALVDQHDALAAGQTTPGEVARKTWDSIENVFGQMNWDARWWHRTFKSIIQLGFRSFTWFAGNIRLGGDAVRGQAREMWNSANYLYDVAGGDGGNHGGGNGPKGTGSASSGGGRGRYPGGTTAVPRLDPNMAKVLALLGVWIAGNVLLQLALTHEGPKDEKDLFAARIGGEDAHGKPNRVTMPAIVFKDWLALRFQGPRAYLAAKASDLVGGTVDVLNNDDFRHMMIHNPDDPMWKRRWDDAKHILGSPIGLSTYKRELQQGASHPKAALGLAGFGPPPRDFDWTKAERRMNEILERDQKHYTQQEMDEYRQQRQAVLEGELGQKEMRKALDGLDTEWALKMFRRLSYLQAVDVYNNYMNEDEQDLVQKDLDKKRSNALKRNPRQVAAADEAQP